MGVRTRVSARGGIDDVLWRLYQKNVKFVLHTWFEILHNAANTKEDVCSEYLIGHHVSLAL